MGLREKMFHLEKSKAMANSFFVSPAKKNSDEMNTIEIAAKENLESQRGQCITALHPNCLVQKVVGVESMEKALNFVEVIYRK